MHLMETEMHERDDTGPGGPESSEPSDHVTLERLEEFGRRELSREEMLRVGWHLAHCDRCRARLPAAGEGAEVLFAGLFPGRQPARLPDVYLGLVGRVLGRLGGVERAVAEERSTAPALVDDLLDHPPERQRWLVDQRRRYQSYAVAEELLERAHNDPPISLAATEGLAGLVLAISQRLTADDYGGEGVLHDLETEGWGLIGDCRRRLAEPGAVVEALEIAERFRQQGSGDLAGKASLLEVRAGWSEEQGLAQQADQELAAAAELFREAAQPQAATRVLVARGRLARRRDDPERAVGLLAEAAELAADRSPHLELQARSELVAALHDADRAEDAAALLDPLRRLAERFASPFERPRILWREALVRRDLGEIAAARELLAEVRDLYLAMDSAWDGALVELDLAVLELEHGRSEAVGFRSVGAGLHREALAALARLQRAFANGTATRELVDDVRAFLERARRWPDLHYRGGDG